MGPDGSEAVPALSERLTDPDITVRHNAALALAKIGPSAESAAGALQAAQEDEDLYVRENARIALSRIEA